MNERLDDDFGHVSSCGQQGDGHDHFADVGRALRTAGGKVAFSADLYIIRPKDEAKSNGIALVEVRNVFIEELPPTPNAPTWDRVGHPQAKPPAAKSAPTPPKPAAAAWKTCKPTRQPMAW